MADFACDRKAKALEFKAARKVLEAPAEPRHRDPGKEDRAMPFAAYNIRLDGCVVEQTGTFKSIGELAAELVRKAGGK